MARPETRLGVGRVLAMTFEGLDPVRLQAAGQQLEVELELLRRRRKDLESQGQRIAVELSLIAEDITYVGHKLGVLEGLGEWVDGSAGKDQGGI